MQHNDDTNGPEPKRDAHDGGELGAAGDKTSPARRKPAVPIALAAASLAALFIVVLAVFGSGAATDDDMAIALALSGAYPDSGLCLFVNAFVSRLALLIAGISPGVNAFFLVEYCLVALGAFVFVYAALAYIDDQVVALCTIGLLALLLVPGCTFLKNFTVVATLSTLAGFFALVVQIGKGKPSIPLSIAAVTLCAFGFMIRFESFLLALPFAVIALAYKIWMHADREGRSSKVRGIALNLAPFAAVLVLCAAAAAYDAAAWSSPEWSDWKTYNHARSTISDFPMPDYSEIEAELSAGGIAEIDYDFARSFRTADKDVFTVDSLEFIASFVGEAGDGVVAEIMSQKVQAWVAMYWYAVPLGIALIALYVMRARKLSARSNVVVAIAVAVFAVATFYVASGGRLPQRVMYSLVADAVVCLAAIIGDGASVGKRHRESPTPERLRKVACAVGLAFCVASACVVAYTSHLSLDNYGQGGIDGEPVDGVRSDGLSVDEGPVDGELAVRSSISGYMRANDDVLFVTNTTVEYRYLAEYGMKQVPPRDELERLFFLGGWSTGSPYINARNEMMDMENVMKGLVENERARYLVHQSGNSQIAEMETYLETHYWDDVVVELVDSFEAKGVTYLVYDFSVAP